MSADLIRPGKRIAFLCCPCVEPSCDNPVRPAGVECSPKLKHEGAFAHSPVRVDPYRKGRRITRSHDQVYKARYLASDAQYVLAIRFVNRLVVEEDELIVYGKITHVQSKVRRTIT